MHFLYEHLGRGLRGGNGRAGEKITRLLGCATVYVLIHLKWLQSVRILNGLSVVETDPRVMVILKADCPSWLVGRFLQN